MGIEWIDAKAKLPFTNTPSDWKGCLCDDFLVTRYRQQANG